MEGATPLKSRRIKIHRKSGVHSGGSTSAEERPAPGSELETEVRSGSELESSNQNDTTKGGGDVNSLFSGFLAKKLEIIEEERKRLERSAQQRLDDSRQRVESHDKRGINGEVELEEKMKKNPDQSDEDEGEDDDDDVGQVAEAGDSSHSKKKKSKKDKKHKHKHKKEHKKKDKDPEKQSKHGKHKDKKHKDHSKKDKAREEYEAREYEDRAREEYVEEREPKIDLREKFQRMAGYTATGIILDEPDQRKDRSLHERGHHRDEYVKESPGPSVHKFRDYHHVHREEAAAEPVIERFKSREIPGYGDLDMWSEATGREHEHSDRDHHRSHSARHKREPGKQDSEEPRRKKRKSSSEKDARHKSSSSVTHSTPVEEELDEESKALAKIKKLKESVQTMKASLVSDPVATQLQTESKKSVSPKQEKPSATAVSKVQSEDPIVLSDSEERSVSKETDGKIQISVNFSNEPAACTSEDSNQKPTPQVSNDEDSRPGPAAELSGPKKPAMKFGIKISNTSAALISSGVVMEGDLKKKDLEEGEVTDSSDGASSSSTDDDVGSLGTDGSLSDAGSSKKHKKKRKKKDKKKKKKKKSHRSSKDKEGSAKKRHGSSRSRTPKDGRRSRSRSRSGSYDKRTGVWKSRSRSRSPGFYRSRGRRSTSRDRDYSRRRRSRSRSRERRYDRPAGFYQGFRRRSRSRSRSPQRPFRVRRTSEDLRVKIDKAKLREIALKNAYASFRAGHGPRLDADQLAVLKAGGKSVEELTNFCKKISEKDGTHGSDSSDSDYERLLPGSDEDADSPFIHHPFKVNPNAEIVMNIRNAKQLPLLSQTEKFGQGAQLRLQFPVSSGNQHRKKEDEWVPVERTKPAATATTTTVAKISSPAAASTTTTTTTPSTATTATPNVSTPALSAKQICDASVASAKPPVSEADKVFPDPPPVDINIGAVVSERLSAMRKLQDNPHDVQAITSMYKVQKQMSRWAEPLPGQFTGSTGVQILSQSQLQGGHQAWITKDTFTRAQPVKGGVGMFLLQKMGWKEGEGLGKNNEGGREPLMLDFKVDRKGLTSMGEVARGSSKPAGGVKITRDLSGKHPVSALVEMCSKRHWGAPQFTVVQETGPDHKKNFLFKVKINGQEYQPAIGANNKKQAKMQAASACLQELGLIPR